MKLDIRRTTETKAIEFCRKHEFRYRLNRHSRIVIGRIKGNPPKLAMLEVLPDEAYVAPRRRSLEPRSPVQRKPRCRRRQHYLPFGR